MANLGLAQDQSRKNGSNLYRNMPESTTFRSFSNSGAALTKRKPANFLMVACARKFQHRRLTSRQQPAESFIPQTIVASRFQWKFFFPAFQVLCGNGFLSFFSLQVLNLQFSSAGVLQCRCQSVSMASAQIFLKTGNRNPLFIFKRL